MRSSYMFRDQVQKVTNWFKSWNECEQTVALFSLLRKLNSTQARFLEQVLGQSLLDDTELHTIETQANNPAYISSLCQETKETAVSQLLYRLPLLRPGNTDAKAEYLKILPRILNHSVEHGCHIEESRQLLSYSLIHPAMTTLERSHLTVWLSHLEERYAFSMVHSEEAQDNSNLALKQNWQQQVAGLNNNDSVSPTAEMIGLALNQNQGNNGRAITSTSAVNQCLKLGHGVDVNLNGAGLLGDHTPLSNTLSNSNPLSNSHSNLAPSLSGTPMYTPSHVSSTSGGVYVNSSQPGLINVNTSHRKLTRSVSAVAPSTHSLSNPPTIDSSHVSDWLNRHHDEMVQDSYLHPSLVLTQSEPPHAPLSPQSSISSSGSGSEGNTHHDDQHQMRNTFLEEGSGMRDVPVWLKSLRLHKYSYLFQTMTYQLMLGLNEDWLKSQNVTKGARNKIILNVQKLQERHKVLQAMEKDVMESGNMKQALTELRSMMNTPIKVFGPPSHDELTSTTLAEFSSGTEDSANSASVESSPENKTTPSEKDGKPLPDYLTCDLPGEITRVLGKICTQLLVSTRPEDECFSMYLQMLDKSMMHEAFTMDQKRKLLSWRQQIQKIWHPTPQRFGLDRQRKSFGNTFPPNNALRTQRALRGPMLIKPGAPKWTFGHPPPVTLAPIGSGTNVGIPLYRNNAFAAATTGFTPIRPTMMDMKSPLARTHSAPIKSNAFGFALGSRPIGDMCVTEPEINARLDSLCLSMTEHALGSFSDVL